MATKREVGHSAAYILKLPAANATETGLQPQKVSRRRTRRRIPRPAHALSSTLRIQTLNYAGAGEYRTRPTPTLSAASALVQSARLPLASKASLHRRQLLRTRSKIPYGRRSAPHGRPEAD